MRVFNPVGAMEITPMGFEAIQAGVIEGIRGGAFVEVPEEWVGKTVKVVLLESRFEEAES